jgi:(p)ppGpp synthase/HD superfamily hydrolase
MVPQNDGMSRRDEPSLDDAIALAVSAHRGQRYPTLELGRDPFVLHPLRVMLGVSDDTDRIVAVLHDTVEDTDVSLATLTSLGYSKAVVDAVDAMSRRDREPYEEYIERVSRNATARRVKLADLADNLANNRGFDTPQGERARRRRWQRAVRRLRIPENSGA